MTEEEKKRWGEELKRIRQAENKAKGAHKTSARPDAPRATTGQEDTNTALEAETQGIKRPNAGGQPKDADAPRAAGARAKAAGIAAAKAEEERQKKNQPDVPDPAAVSTGTSAVNAGGQPDAAGAAATKKDETGKTGKLPGEPDPAASTGTSTVDAGAQPQGVQNAPQTPDGTGEGDPTGTGIVTPSELGMDMWADIEIGEERERALAESPPYTPGSVGESVSIIKSGRGANLSDEAMKEVEAFLQENPELNEELSKLGTGEGDAKEDEYAFLLGKETKIILSLTESPYLSDAQRGEAIEMYVEDKQAARAEGHYQLDGYYRAHPEALWRYDGLREADEAGDLLDKQNKELYREAQMEELGRIVDETVAQEQKGELTEENREMLAMLNSMEVFNGDDPFFQEQFDATIEQLQDAGIQVSMILNDAAKPLVREKQAAMMLGMDLQTFWRENPERARTPEEYVQSALERYDSLYTKPLNDAVRGRMQEGYINAVLDYLLGLDEQNANPGVGLVEAGKRGVESGTAWVLGGAANAAYMALGESQEKTIRDNLQSYWDRYGIWAPAMYRNDALSIIREYYTPEEGAALLEAMAKSGDIFDLGIDTRPYLHEINNFAKKEEEKQRENRMYFVVNGTPGELWAYDLVCTGTSMVELVLIGSMTTGVAGTAVGAAVTGIPTMGNRFQRMLLETGDWDASKNAAFGRWVIDTGIALMPVPRGRAPLAQGTMERGAYLAIQEGGAPAMRSLWMNICAWASHPAFVTAGKSALATASGEMFEDFMLYGRMEDGLKILRESIEAGRVGGAVAVAMWGAGTVIPELSAACKRMLGKNGQMTLDDVNELCAVLENVQQDPQALQQIHAGQIQTFTDKWVAQAVSAGLLNTPVVASASIAATDAAKSLRAQEAVVQEKQGAWQANWDALEEAKAQLMASSGPEVEGMAEEVEKLAAAFEQSDKELTGAQGELAQRQAAANEANAALDKLKGEELNRLRATGARIAEETYGQEQQEANSGQTDEQAEGMEAQPPQEVNTPEALPAQEADAQAETGMEEENISEEAGDLQQTGNANDGIMNAQPGDPGFIGPVREQSSDQAQKTGFVGNVSAKDLTKALLATKPYYSRNPKKWLENGGQISIDEDGNWTYTNAAGISVTYIGNNPDFKGAGYVVQEVNIGEFKNYKSDFKKADKMTADTPRDKANDTWHHFIEQGQLQELNKDIHKEFSHAGGMSINRARRKEK